MAKVYHRMFFVGLGGSGGKTLRFLKRDLNYWLRNVGWEDGIPQGWQFLQIDTPTVADGAEIRSAPMLTDDEYLGLVAKGITFEDVDNALMNSKQTRDEFSSWRVHPQGLGVPIHTGAGMYRAVGRTVALAYLAAIRTRLTKSFSRLNQPEAQASLSRLYKHVYNEDPSVEQPAPIVVIASSLAGGTGAGLINDVCDLIREIDPVAGDASFGLLYTPEVFESIAPIAKGGIQPNSLAAICEVLNGYWWNGGSGTGLAAVPKKNSQLMRSAGAVAEYNKTGPAFPFLVGAQNSAGVKYQSDRQLFEVVGAALTSWATDRTVQDQLLAFTYANWRARADDAAIRNANVLVNQGSAGLNETGVNPFNALGFSRVSVGNTYFERYSAERLARDAIDFLRNNHDVGSFAQSLRRQQPNITTDELVQRQCEQNFKWFVSQCRLDEKGPNNNQVLERIQPEEDVTSALFNKCLEQAVEWAHQDGNHTAAEWMSTIEPAVENAAIAFDQECQQIIDDRIKTWIKDQPKITSDAVTQAAGEFGIQVTRALVERLKLEIMSTSEGIISDLRSEITEYTQYSLKSEWSGQAAAAFTQPSRKVPSGAIVEQACRQALEFAVCTTWIRVRELTIELLDKFASGYLDPLQQALSKAIAVLSTAATEVDSWPTWSQNREPGSLSPSSTPPLSEYTLMKPETFSDTFDALLARAVGGDLTQSAMHRDQARLSTICGAFLEDLIKGQAGSHRALEGLRFLIQSQEWWPGVAVVHDSHKASTIAVFNFGVDTAIVRARAEAWLWDEKNPFRKILSASLRTYTAPVAGVNDPGVSDLDYQERQAEFVEAFEKAMSASKPLVGLDTQLMAALFNDNSYPHIALEVSSLPFEDHPLFGPISTRLNSEFARLPNPKDSTSYFTKGDRTTHIDIVSSLYGAYPVLVIESLLKPIAQAWNSLTDDTARQLFWDKRRARPLTEFIPAPQAHVLCMTRGWFIGRALGLVTRTDKTQAWSVAPRGNEVGTKFANLPATTLSRSSTWGDAPALILESLGLAYVEVGRQNRVDPLQGYVNLLELGKDGNGTSPALASYGTIGDFVAGWVRTGKLTVADGVEPSNPRVRVEGDATAPDRLNALIAHLDEVKSRYSSEYVKYQTQILEAPDGLGTAPLWPSMHRIINSALSQLLESLRVMTGQLSSGSDTTSDDDE